MPTPRKEGHQYYVDMQERILDKLTEKPVCTTEELRVAAIEDLPVTWGQLRRMEKAGLIEGSRPKPGRSKKWRRKA